MSAEARQAIAAAASTVDGIKASPWFRQTTKTGDALVRLDRWNRDESGLGFVATWQLVVVLPSDYAAAEKYIEEKAPALVAALSTEAVVTTVTPSQIVLEQGATVPVLLVEAVREEDQ